MNEIIHTQTMPLPVPMKALPAPSMPMTVRVGTRGDMAFIDSLQKKHSKALGFFSRKILEGYIDGGHVLVAVSKDEGGRMKDEGATGDPFPSSFSPHPSSLLGYVISRDRYLRRDELGAIFQLCVAPGCERQFIAANLLREVFERSAYGCKLYCCWCAQDLAANRFWEAMGFVPIAYRQGGLARHGGRSMVAKARRERSVAKGKTEESECDSFESLREPSTSSSLRDPSSASRQPRVHIFWQKRIRAGDTSTPYWFPAKTEGGAIREDRIILPIPPGMRWADALPVLVDDEDAEWASSDRSEPAAREGTKAVLRRKDKPARHRDDGVPPRPVLGNGLRFAGKSDPSPAARAGEAIVRKAKRRPARADAGLIARARELRDRWMEHVNAHGIEQTGATYDLFRSIGTAPPAAIDFPQPKRLAA